MGAGKSTLGSEVARRLQRPFLDVDARIEESEGPIPRLFEQGVFRDVEERTVLEAFAAPPAVIALGGGAVETSSIREALRERAVTVLVEVDVDTAWRRAGGGDRPLAQDETSFRELYERRQPLYAELADGRARDADGVVLAAGGIVVEPGAFARLEELVPGPAELVSDARVLGLHPPPLDLPTHVVRGGEEAKTVESVARLWRELRLDRAGALVALGGGSVTDAAGFAAATYLRGIDWVAVPTTLVGQVDAAIGGKTAVNLPEGKNLVGAFHWPARTVIDPQLLETLPEEQRREGMAEVVKTGLLAGEPLWELPDAELVRRCAAFKAALCIRDPYDEGPRQTLNLGHTFAHALEAGADYETVSHGRAVALGLLAALRLSGRSTDAVEATLAPDPVRVDRERAWEALQRDKKAEGGELKLVLLGEDGAYTAPVAAGKVRRALDELIAH
jgi:3-dehydroquinate synthetase/shikimate kinase